MEETNKEDISENIEIIDGEIIIEETIETEESKIYEEPTENSNKFFEKIKDKKEKYSDNYKAFSKNYEKSDDSVKKLSDKISWDIIKILIYFYILTFIVTDLQNFLFVSIFALLLIKLDVIEFIVEFIRSSFKKD